MSEGREGGGGANPISQEIAFFKSQHKSHNPSLCCSNWNPIPIFLLFFFHESQSQCTKSHFPASKKGKSQLPFYKLISARTRSTWSAWAHKKNYVESLPWSSLNSTNELNIES